MDSTFVTLKESTSKELDIFAEMEKDDDTISFIIPYSIEKHKESFSNPEIIYLTIYHNNEICGFFILSLDSDKKSIEFRRIVVSIKGRGIGQEAISKMHIYCKAILGKSRIWLDVFEHNVRGRHIYEKFGYQHYKSEPYENHTLYFYEKAL